MTLFLHMVGHIYKHSLAHLPTSFLLAAHLLATATHSLLTFTTFIMQGIWMNVVAKEWPPKSYKTVIAVNMLLHLCIVLTLRFIKTI